MRYFSVLTIVLCAIILSPYYGYSQASREAVIIQGTVTSKADGEPLIGVSVAELDASNRVVAGTVTNFNGQYLLRVSNANGRLMFSYMGFQRVVLNAENRTRIDLQMVEESTSIAEVTVTGTRKTTSQGGFSIPEREVSTAMQSISTKEFEGLQVTSIDDALQGHIAGLDIVANSSDPGAPTSMRIRGVNTINSNAEPLIVLNGVPYSLDVDPNFDYANSNTEQYANMLSINPDDIEQIEVLKDAAASAVWGTKGANGVIMITTKKGVAGPTRVTYSYRFTRTKQPQGKKILTGDDYTMFIKEAYLNPRQDDEANDLPEYNYDRNFPDFENYNNNTDWIKEVSQIGYIHNHNLTVYGGGDRAKYRLSGEYLTQRGTIIGQNLERYSSRLALEYNVSDRIQFVSETAFTFTNNRRSYDNYLGIAYNKMPNVSVYMQDRDGNDTEEFFNIPRTSQLNDSQKNLRNPIALSELATNRSRSTRILPQVGIRYHLLDPVVHLLRLNIDATFDVNNDKSNVFLPANATNLRWMDRVNEASDASSQNLGVFSDANLLFVPNFENKDHSLSLYASMQISTGNSSSQQIVTSGLPAYDLIDASNLGYIESARNGRSSYRGLGFMTRWHYAYKGRYITSGTLRQDGSTRFGKGNRWATSPGLSLKWIMSDEPFLDSADWLSMLAFRGSWGISGNQPGSDYLHYSRYGIYGSYMNLPAVKPNSLRLDALKWETATAYNLGAEFAVIDYKYSADFNYYKTRIDDMLFSGFALSSSSGFPSLPYVNAGIMENEGWELYLNFNRFVEVKDFSMDFKINFANNRNTIIEIDPTILKSWNAEFNYTNGTYLTRIQERNSFGSIYGFRYKGTYKYDKFENAIEKEGSILGADGVPLAPFALDAEGNVIYDHNGKPKPMYFSYNHLPTRYQFRGGDAIYEDINNDGTIDELDIVYLGNSNPKIHGGFGLDFRYKRFMLRNFFNFRYGNKVVNSARMHAENMYTDNNQSIAVNWRWRHEGDVTDMPRALYQYGYNWLGSDRYVEDGSFLRFKYMQLNYDFPKSMLQPYHLERLSFYMTINNLFLLTKYSGVDPEVGYGGLGGGGISYDNNRTPRTRDFVFGVTIGF